ncbi:MULTISPECIES: hypothetical protein [Dyella]|uniref:Uncharacterized protein n=1 Tax=Dyella halodurans TaxID=1920171 RepID=A0ABV9C4W3_9GAMM|nr:hypothetical protein [Dyella halodurans]
MRIVTRLIAMNRGRQLGRQFREIEHSINELPKRSRSRLGTMALREIGQAARSDFPHLYGTPPEERYLPWGQGTDIGFARARSDNPEVAMRGIALWLAAAYHETKDTPYPNLQPHHRQLMRVLRELKEDHRADTVEKWMQAPAAA